MCTQSTYKDEVDITTHEALFCNLYEDDWTCMFYSVSWLGYIIPSATAVVG